MANDSYRPRMYSDDYEIDYQDCTGIYNSSDLITKIKNSFVSALGTFDSRPTFYLYPYCSEETKIGGGLDQINKGAIEFQVITDLKDTFKCNFLCCSLKKWYR